MPTDAANTESVDVAGRCYCGAVAFAVRIPEGDAPIFTAYCHCDSCRRAHAAPLYHVACVDDSMFEVTAGAEHLNDFCKPGGTIVRAFCNVCGSRILNRFPGWKPGGRVPIAFFPNLLDEADQNPLPAALQPAKHNEADDCVLNWQMLDSLRP